jgi:nicotinamidase-related amidase
VFGARNLFAQQKGSVGMPDPHIAPDPTRSALIIIDTQNDFTLPDAPAHITGTAEAVPAMKHVLGMYRVARRPIVHVIRLYKADGSNADACRHTLIASGRAIVAPGTHGAEIVTELKLDPSVSLKAETLLSGEPQTIGNNEFVLYKSRWSAFYLTKLESLLASLGINTLVIMGCNFPNCPRATIYDASSRDLRLVVVADAISGLYDKGLDELHSIGVTSLTSKQVGAWLSSRS